MNRLRPPVRRTRRLAGAAVMLIMGIISAGVTSCSDSRSSSASLTVSTETSRASVSSPTDQTLGAALNEEASGEDYLAIVTPMNCAIKQYGEQEAKFNIGDNTMDSSNLGSMKSLMSEVAQARRTAAGKLVATNWPEEIEPTVSELSQAWFGLAKIEDALSLAVSDTQWNLLMQEYNSQIADPALGGLSSLIRAALSLPDNGADYVRNLKC